MIDKYELIKKANEQIKTTGIGNKEYAEVNQRIKAFRMVYPEGFITNEIVSLENGICIIRATVGFYREDGEPVILGIGTAYEKEGSTFINKTSYIENCETSACGRALGMAGFGIDVSVASAEEVQNAIANQDKAETKEEPKPKKASPNQIELLAKTYVGENLEKLLKANNLTKLEDMPMSKASEIIRKLKAKEANHE